MLNKILYNSPIAIPELPNPMEIFGDSFYEPLVALDHFYHFSKRKNEITCLYTAVEVYQEESGQDQSVHDGMVNGLEWEDLHIHIHQLNNITYFQYLKNIDALEEEQLLLNFLYSEPSLTDDFFVLHPHFAAGLLDSLGCYSVKTNSVSIDINSIVEWVKESDQELSFNELFTLVLYHQYGHWIAYNLSIALTPVDQVQVSDVKFQELFAQLFCAHLLHKDGNSELREKMDLLSKTQPLVYQEYLLEEYSDCITSSDYLMFILDSARSCADSFSFRAEPPLVDIVDDLNDRLWLIELASSSMESSRELAYEIQGDNNFDRELSIKDWKDMALFNAKYYWTQRDYFHNKDMVDNALYSIPKCECGKSPSKINLPFFL